MEESVTVKLVAVPRHNLLYPWIRAALTATVLCGCGPQVGNADTSGSGDGTGSEATSETSTGLPSTSSSSSGAADESTTTSIVPGCGNGIFEDGEWCFERHTVSVLEGQGEPFRVLAGGEGEPGFSLWAWGGFFQVNWDGEQLSFPEEPYFDAGRRHLPDSVVFRAKLILAGEGRVDLLHYSPLDSFCYTVSGPSRTPYIDPLGPVHYALGLDCARGNLLFPIRLPGLELDAHFFSDPFDERSMLYHVEFPPEEFFSPGDGNTEPLQWMEAPPPCGVRLGHAANVQGDAREEAVLLADECVDDGQYGLFVHTPESDLSLSDAAVRLGDVPLPEPPVSWMVLPPASGGEHARIVVAGPGYATLLSFGERGTPIASDLDVEALPLQFSHEDGPLQRLPLGQGLFEPDGSTAIAINSDDGIRVVALDATPLGLFEEDAESYAVSDLNGDGWGDLAALVDGQVVVHISNP